MTELTKAQHKKKGISLRVLLLFCFAFTALLPVSILAIKVYRSAWDNAQREVIEKHQLLAENLAAPIQIYVSKLRTALNISASLLDDPILVKDENKKQTREILINVMQKTDGLKSIFLFDENKKLLASIGTEQLPAQDKLERIGSFPFTYETYLKKRSIVSNIVLHPASDQPALFISVAIPGNDSRILVGELDIGPIEKLREGIRFGKGGHSAIVDAKGVVIAHPNPSWMRELKDLSNLPIVKNMMAGKTGVSEFYSPFKKQQMVAGYTSVPVLGWGIMVPQPRMELEAQVEDLLYSTLTWGVTGLIVALLTAYLLGIWITQPLRQLATAGHELSMQGFRNKLPSIRDNAPAEIQQLSASFSDAIHDLSMSRSEVTELNKSLQHRVNEATDELRQANTKLSVLARSDHLTKLANRRHFEQSITNMMARRDQDSKSVCILLVDVDKFKSINDGYGHAAGDMVLIQIAEILDRNMRQSDIAARYAGDEFVAIIHADIEIGRKRAETIRNEISMQKFIFGGNTFNVTVSIGLIECKPSQERESVDSILQKVDNAMYQAKRDGRDQVSELSIS